MNRGFQPTPADLRQGSASFFERHPIQVDGHCGHGLCHSATQWLPVTGPVSTVDLFLIPKRRTASSRLDRGGPFPLFPLLPTSQSCSKSQSHRRIFPLRTRAVIAKLLCREQSRWVESPITSRDPADCRSRVTRSVKLMPGGPGQQSWALFVGKPTVLPKQLRT